MSQAPQGWRRRVAKAALLIGVVVIAGVVVRAYPRTVELRYELGEAHTRLTEARLTYLGEEGEMAGLTLAPAGGLPDHFRHEVDLAPGKYVVEATLVDRQGSTHRVERSFDVPAQSVVQIDLGAGLSAEGGP